MRALAAKKGFGGVEEKAPKKTKVGKTVAAKRAEKASVVVSSGFAYTGSLRPGVQSPRRTVNELLALCFVCQSGGSPEDMDEHRLEYIFLFGWLRCWGREHVNSV